MRIVAIAARTLRWTIAGHGAARGRSERAAVVLEVRNAEGVLGLGEAAPLPGMSRDTLEDAEQAIAALARRVPLELRDAASATAIARDTTWAPAARFAIETALLDALARERRTPLAALLAATPSTRVPLAAAVDDPDEARRAVAAGVTCVKLKLGPDDDLARVHAIARAAPGAVLRIDGNRTWRREATLARLSQLAALPIDFVEEPCQGAHRLLGQPLPCKLALDESLVDLAPADLEAALRSPGLAALVLKPTLVGGLAAALELARRARDAGIAAIVTHGLEGPVGTAACAELALALGGEPPVGLAAHAALAGFALGVPQLAADHVHAAPAAGLGFEGVDLAGLAGVLRALVEPAGAARGPR